jgi:hypothetical protein
VDLPLAIFIGIVVLDAAALLIDAWLLLMNRQTITATVRQHPVLGVPLVALQFFAGLALAMHFLGVS